MSTTVIYERYIESQIRISKNLSQDAVRKKLERWPREAGLSLTLDESGSNFMQIVKSIAADYGLELGDRSWNTREEGGKLLVELYWKMLRNGVEKGLATMKVEIPLTPAGEEGGNAIYNAKIEYKVEISNDVLAEKSGVESMPEFGGLLG